MKVFSVGLVILSYFSSLSSAKEGEQTPQEWLDPGDMTRYDAAAQSIDHTVSYPRFTSVPR